MAASSGRPSLLHELARPRFRSKTPASINLVTGLRSIKPPGGPDSGWEHFGEKRSRKATNSAVDPADGDIANPYFHIQYHCVYLESAGISYRCASSVHKYKIKRVLTHRCLLNRDSNFGEVIAISPPSCH